MKRPQIPYGYKIENGVAVPHPEESRKLQQLFAYYVYYNCSLREAVKSAGIEMSPTSCRNMLENEIYLGTDYYPRLIQPGLMARAKARAAERGQNYSRERESEYRPIPVKTKFAFIADEGKSSASRLYECIQPIK
ncbi:MAG: hypothetical protein J6A79_12335 [Clostridia bacterium]|nr:hypothetical protein [Clostridia bacterium]